MLNSASALFDWISAHKDEALFWATVVLAFATFVVALFTGWLARETRELRKGSDAAMASQIKTAQRAAEASERSAIASQVSAEATKKLVEVGQRSWMLATKIELLSEDKRLTSAMKLRIEVRNVGNGPALRASVDDSLQLHEVLPDEFAFPKTAIESSLTLGPNQFVYVEQSIGLTPAQLEAIRIQKALLVSAGLLKYQDVFGADRQTSWCYLFSVPHNAFIAANKHNRAT